jgi:hypothetical protein
MDSFSAPRRTTVNRPSIKVHSQPKLWAIAIVSFALGAGVSGLLCWQAYRLYRATLAPLVFAEGEVRSQPMPKDDKELSPPPSGYYMETTGLGRVYLTDQPFKDYVGLTIQVQGSVSGICGPKSIPCFPLIEVKEIVIPEQP